jgi:nicotinamide phosphoribosyltransferase
MGAAVEDVYSEAEQKGVVECLWDIFGGTETAKGYKLLDSHVGTIYGDSITRERAVDICERLKAKGFASINWVAGIGSFTYQYNTRDTFGYAMKSTYYEATVLIKYQMKNWEEKVIRAKGVFDITKHPYPLYVEKQTYHINIFKDPVTDDGTKKSAKGLLAVYKDEKGKYFLKDQATWDEVNNCEFKKVFENGRLLKAFTLQEVRDNVKNS